MSKTTFEKKQRRLKRANKSKSPKRKYNRWERDAMAYHAEVMKLVAEGKATKEEGEAELLSASKAAGENLRSQGAPKELVNVVEQLIIYGSYDGMVKALKKIEEGKHENGNRKETGHIPSEANPKS